MPLRVGDYAVRQDGYTEITLRTERLSDRDTPFTLIRGFQYDPGGGGEVFDDVFGFRLNNGTMRMQGSYRGIPRVYYRNTPSIMIGSSSMRVGDTFNNTYTVTNTNTGDNTIESFNGTFAAIETVTTPAGTFDNCMKYTGVECRRNVDGVVRPRDRAGEGNNHRWNREPRSVHHGRQRGLRHSAPACDFGRLGDVRRSDVNLTASGNGGTRWEKQIHNFVHDLGTGPLSVTRFARMVPRTRGPEL